MCCDLKTKANILTGPEDKAVSQKKATFYRFYRNLEVSLKKHAVLPMCTFCEVEGGQSTLSKAI